VSQRRLVIPRAALLEAPADLDELNRLFIKRRWGDGLLIAPPTADSVECMLRHTRRKADDVVATIVPGMGAATVEYIAINAVMAGCYPEYLPVFIAAAEAVATPKFHLQAIQATTNPAAVWLIVNGPIAKWLEVNSSSNCLARARGQMRRSAVRCGWSCRILAARCPAKWTVRLTGSAGEIHFLLCQKRGSEPVGAAARRAVTKEVVLSE
jgi:hypothetical protein